jgi:hypothetical protein
MEIVSLTTQEEHDQHLGRLASYLSGLREHTDHDSYAPQTETVVEHKTQTSIDHGDKGRKNTIISKPSMHSSLGADSEVVIVAAEIKHSESMKFFGSDQKVPSNEQKSLSAESKSPDFKIPDLESTHG